MILETDQFGQIIQSIPAMIPKLVFNNKNLVEHRGSVHKVIVGNVAKLITANEVPSHPTNTYHERLLVSRTHFLIFFYLKTDFMHTRYNLPFTIKAQNSHARYTADSFDVSADRRIRNATVMHPDTFICRIPVTESVIHDEVTLTPSADGEILWYIHPKGVPFFVGVPYEDYKKTKLMDTFTTHSWLEDYADGCFDSIKANDYQQGVRLLQHANY